MKHCANTALLVLESDHPTESEIEWARWALQSLHLAGIERALVHSQAPLAGDILAAHPNAAWIPMMSSGAAGDILRRRASLGDAPLIVGIPQAVPTPELLSDLQLWPVDGSSTCAVVDRRPTAPVSWGADLELGLLKGIGEWEVGSPGLLGWFVLGSDFFDAASQLVNGHPVTIRDVLDRLAASHSLEAYVARPEQWLAVAGATTEAMEKLLHHAPGTTARRRESERVLDYVRGILNAKKGLHYTLMNPGPVLTTARVKSALVHHDICHRDEEFPKVVRRLRRKLRKVFGGGPEHEVVLLTGSGTSGMEAAIASSVPPDKKVLVISNGAFGDRFIEIATLHQMNLVVLKYPWATPVNPEDVRRKLAEDPDIHTVVMVHHETSVGLLNPITEVGRIVRDADRLFLVDAVASLGGEDLNVQRDNIDVCVSSANKCLHAISGVAVVCVNKRAWDRIENIPPRVYYLDLRRYRHYAIEKEETPFTPAVSSFFALDAAVDELLETGVEHRWETYRRRNARIRQRLREMGLEFLTATGRESNTITCVKVPPYITFRELYDEMKRRGYLIYNSKEHLKDRYFQVANMGDLTDEIIEEFLGSLEMVLLTARRKAKSSPALQRARQTADG